jgi:hypothetical protein
MNERTPANLADRISDLEERIEDLRATLEKCRKLVTLAKIAIVCGYAATAAAFVGFGGSGATVFMFGIAASLGGLTLLGSTRSTMAETSDLLDKLEALRSTLTDEVPMRIVGRAGGPLRSVT